MREWLRGGESRLRLQTIVRLRWLAVLGQTLTVIFVYWVMGIDLPIGACLAVISLSAWLNVALRLRYPASQRLRSRYAFVMLGYDILQLGALLYLTGGLENPFAFLLIAPVTVSASTLPPRDHRRAWRARHPRGDATHRISSAAPVVSPFAFRAAARLCVRHVDGGGARHPVHRLLLLAHRRRVTPHGGGAGRRRARSCPRAEVVGARRARRRRRAWPRHAARNHRRGDQGAAARREARRPASRRPASAPSQAERCRDILGRACRRRRAARFHRLAPAYQPSDRGGGGAAPSGRGADRG